MATHKEALHQTLAVMTIILNELHFGIGIGWLAPTINTQSTHLDLPFTVDDISWIASAEYIGKIFGCILPVFLLDTVGRKLLIAGSATGYFFVWSGITIFNSVWIVCCARLIFGVARGVNNTINAIYLAEISSPSLRGTFGTVTVAAYNVGLLLEYALATYLPYKITALVNAFFGAITIGSVFWLVEPIHYLLLKNKLQRAQQTFLWLNGVTDFTLVSHQFQQIRQNVELEKCKKSSYTKLFTSEANYKSVLIVLFAYTLPDATGYTAVLIFSSVMLTHNELTIVLGALECVMCFYSMSLINQYNRRPLLLTSFCFIAILQACTSVVMYVNERIAPVPYFHVTLFGFFAAYVSVISVAYAAIFTIRGELFPLSVKAIGGCVAVIGNSMVNFTITKAFLFISTSYGVYVNFVVYTGVSVVYVVFLYFCLPETRNKSLTQIQEEFNGVKLPRDNPSEVELL